MKFTWKKQLTVLVAGASLVALLTGCGSTTNATSGNSNSSNTATNQSGNGQHRGGRGNFNIVQRFQDAGASQSDATDLANLVKQDHINPMWIMTQLKNKVSVSTIKDDITSGKAPKATRNANGKGNWNGGNGGSNGNNSGNGSSSNSTGSDSSSSSNGTSN